MSFNPATIVLVEGGEPTTTGELQREADEKGIPGPKVDEHPDGYDGECLCWGCLTCG